MVKFQKASLRCSRTGWHTSFIIGCISLLIFSLLVNVIVLRIDEIQNLNQIDMPKLDILNNLSSIRISNSDGRQKCSRLVLFLHIHKAGGTSVLEFMKDSNYTSIYKANAHLKPPLVQLLSTNNATLPIYGLYGARCDQMQISTFPGKEIPIPMKCRTKQGYVPNGSKEGSYSSLPISDTPPLQLSDSSLWRGIHAAGADYVAFEYNFLPPSVFVDFFDDIRPTIASVAVLRDPWRRFHSTYQRELFRKCLSKGKKKKKKKKKKPVVDVTKCIRNNSLMAWMKDSSFEPNAVYPGILKPNYLVRMLNGIADQPNLTLTQDHLESAKVALEQFDLVLYTEMPQEERTAALRSFFGTDDRAELKHISNNYLKDFPDYEKVVAMSSLWENKFYKLNAFDMELYGFAKILVERRRQEPAVQC